MAATALRRELFETLKRMAYEKEAVVIERRGKAIAALVPAEAVAQPRVAPRPARPMVDPKALADFCARHNAKTLYLFGSVLTDEFGPDSDVDVMFEPDGPTPSYFKQMEMTDELQGIFGRPVDLVSRSAIESSSNPFRKKAILESARIVYAKQSRIR